MNTHIRTARTLADDALLAGAKSLADRERGATVELIAHLMEVERRKLHLASGYSTMFIYRRRARRLSEAETFNRLKAARAARRFPVILDRLTEGAVNLTTVKLLAKHLTADNHLAVLESARGSSRREVEKIVARLAPVPDVPATVRKLPVTRSVPTPTTISSSARSAASAAVAAVVVPAGPPPPPFADPAPLAPPSTPAPRKFEVRPAVVNALSPDRYKLQLTISGETLEKLELAKDMIRRADPSGDVAQIVDRALTLLLHDLAKKKFAVTDRPRSSQGVAAESHTVSAEVKRIVFVRDLGRCAFVSKDGRRCDERASLEFHHARPLVEGGPPTVENIELRCQPHNLYEWYVRSTEVRAREEEWRCRQVAAGVVPWTAPTGPGTSRAQGRAVESLAPSP